MTDEEMAGEYAGNISGLDINTTIMVAENKTDAYRLGIYEGFLAGLKAGRPQWNYMKDVNCYEDLPHNEDVYYAYVVNVGAYDKPTIERKLGSFAEFEFDVMAYHVIAWCEIPTFDKE